MLLKYEPKVDHLKMVTLTPKDGLVLERTMVKLLPGTNEVTQDEWKAMRGNIVAELESGEIKTLAQKVSAGRGKVGGIKAVDLKQMPTNLAVKYVSECNNPDTLTKWYSEITNEEVRLAITKKFEKLNIDRPEDKIPDGKLENEAPMSLDELDAEDGEEEEDAAGEEDAGLEDDEDGENETDAGSEDEDGSQVDYSELKLDELKAICKERGISTSKFTKKEDYIAALTNGEE